MNTSTFQQDRKQFFDRYPTAYTAFIFLHSFAVFTAGDCIFSVHADWSFRAHIGELAARSLFFAVFFPLAMRWWQRQGVPRPVSTKPRA